ncbi:MAG TPA: ABC transporter permease [Aliidongia sp.]|nr:ABC transporter permease [Aliidongia sp.]
MFRNALVTTLRGLRRDWFQAGINIGGLALGLAAAILIGLFIRDELNYERFLPGQENLYRTNWIITPPGQQQISIAETPSAVSRFMTLDFPEIEAVTRLKREILGVRRGDIDRSDSVLSADPNFLDLFRFPVLAGDRAGALATPDSVVLTETAAFRYFGGRDPVGETIEIGHGRPMRVTAVLRDPPSETHFDLNIIVSGLAGFTELGKEDARAGPSPAYFLTYLRLRPGADPAALAVRFDDFIRHRVITDPDTYAALAPVLEMRRIADLHLHPVNLGEPKPGGDLRTIRALASVAMLILLAASFNFVNLLTARATRRAVEVGVRKLSGASRSQLFAQFMAETVASAVLALILALGAVELTLPFMNAFLGRTILFAYWREPGSLASLGALALLVGGLAGIYPALVLSSYRPAVALKAARLPSGGRLRAGLVILQFAVSIGLIVATAIIQRQTAYATGVSMRDAAHPILLISNMLPPFPETSFETLRDRLAGVLGVRRAAASSLVPTNFSTSVGSVHRAGHEADPQLAIDRISIDGQFLELYGLRPIAGRGFSSDRRRESDNPVVLTEAGVRFLGFPSAEAAVGEEIMVASGSGGADPDLPARIIGVVPDFIVKSVREAPEPIMFTQATGSTEFLSVELDGARLADTVAAIDRIWHEIAPDQPIRRFFLDERVAALYLDLARESQIFGVFSAIAVLIGGLGLYGLAGFTAERRTKEIGIRKALGASTADVLALMLWQFTLPVLLANALAWPVAWLAMRRWLDGFPLRIELPLMPFVLAGLAALAVALLTTGYHAIAVARARPVAALRYE